jgi:hypothetical protein
METQIRALFYSQVMADRQVTYNPLEPEPFDLVDLTIDVTNSTRIYHTRTECVREALEGANLVITDSQPLANAVKQALPRVAVTALPFGLYPSPDLPERNEPPVIGLLNHSDETEMNNAYALSMLSGLDRPLLIFGAALPGLEATVQEDFGQFCAMCDILLLPSLPAAINSPTLPLVLMSAGTALLCHNAPGYYDLDGATGVQMLPYETTAWRAMLSVLEGQPLKLKVMQDRNRMFAIRRTRESLVRLSALLAQPRSPRQPLSEDCGCAPKGDSHSGPPGTEAYPKISEPAPTDEPANQSIIDHKE